MSTVSPAKAWLFAARPKTLTAAVVPVFVATAFVAGERAVLWSLSAWALCAAIAIQVGTNFFNDAIDFEKGTDREDRLGPARAVASGWLSARVVFAGAGVAFVVAAVCAVPLVVHSGAPILAIAFVSLVCGWAYTGGPFPLSYTGLGDLFVLIFFGLVAVLGTVFVHAPERVNEALVAGIQVGLLATVLIAVNNLRDVASDRLSGKRTLAVRFGETFSRGEITLFAVAPFLLGLHWLREGKTAAALLPCFAAPLAIRLVMGVWSEKPGAIYNSFLARAAALHLLFGLLLGVGFLTGR